MKAFAKLNRNYKDRRPEDTINIIKLILKDCGININKTGWTKFISGVHSLRIESTTPLFGANGKGRSRNYAKASAYAEYIERIQNNLLVLGQPLRQFFLSRIKSKTGYYYYPDEIDLAYDAFMKLPDVIIRELMNFENKIDHNKISELFINGSGGYKTITAVPFYDVDSESIEYIPLRPLFSLIGSTGMAAGNTIEEAIYQGMCEIIERYSASVIYFNRLTPPTIPDEYLRKYQKEYKLIEEIRAIGAHVTVKDFSCGKGLPAVGIIVYDPPKKNYRLNVGADTCFQVALSRCITEILQGYESCEEWFMKFLPVPQEEFSYFFANDELSSRKRAREFEKFTINGDGVFPFSIFKDCESYSFNEMPFHTQINYKEEVKALKIIFHKLGSKLYVRDVSFLGFPSVYIYATNVSLITRKNITLTINDYDMTANKNMADIDRLFNHKANYLKPDFIRCIVNVYSENLSKIENAFIGDVLRLNFSSCHIMSKFPIAYIFFLNRFRNKDYAGSLRYFDIAMKLLHVKNNAYFNGLRKYIEAHISKQSVKATDSKYQEMKQKSILSNIEIPNCPHCFKCRLMHYCESNKNVNTHINLLKIMSKNKIEQIWLRKCFV